MSQQYRNPAVGTSDASGNLTVTFPAVAVNTVASGVVSVPAAPSGAVFQIMVNGQPMGSAIGSTPFGTLQIQNTDQLTLVGTGLLPKTQYTAVFLGSLNYGQVPNMQIQPQATAVLSSSPPDLLYNSTVTLPASGTATLSGIVMPAPYQSIMVIVENAGNNTETGIENSTSGGFFGFNGPIAGNTFIAGAGSTFIFPMVNEPGDDLTIKFDTSGTGGTVACLVFGVRAVMAVSLSGGPAGGYVVTTAAGIPLEVVEYGGTQIASDPIGSGGTVGIITAPAAGHSLRLHSWGIAMVSGSTKGGAVQLGGNTTGTAYATELITEVNSWVGGHWNLDGELCTEQINFTNQLDVTATAFVFYDTVLTPSIP